MKKNPDMEEILKNYFTSCDKEGKEDKYCLDPEWMGSYIENTLKKSERKKVERHISSCSFCFNEFVSLYKILKTGEESPEENLPDHLNLTFEEIVSLKENTFNKISINCFKCGEEIIEGSETCPGCGLNLNIDKEEGTDMREEIVKWLPDFLRENKWLVGTIIAFAASFAFPVALFQFLLAAGLMGGMWIFEKNKREFLREIKEALEMGDREKAEDLAEKLSREIG